MGPWNHPVVHHDDHPTAPSRGAGTGAQSTITQDQQTLMQDEAKVAADQQQEAVDVARAQQASGTSITTTTSTSTTTTTNPADCSSALAEVAKNQQRMSADQAAVAKDEAALAQALGQQSSGASGGSGASGSPPQTSKALAATPSGSTGNTGSGAGAGTGSGGGGTGSSASTDTPQQIAADQAAIDSAQATLTRAEQSLAEAGLTSPISGTVVSVGIHVGDTVSAGSSTEVIVIIGTQSYEVTGTLTSTQVPSVKVGDTARVQVDGIGGILDGTVSQVGPVQSGTSGYTYPVVVALPSSATGLFAGSTANVVIATGSVANVTAVPTSAVQTLGSGSYVEVLSEGIVTRKLIKVGVVGEAYTQVLSGLTPGESVVLADYAAVVPSSNTNTFGGLGGGGFGGAGGPQFQRIDAAPPGGSTTAGVGGG